MNFSIPKKLRFKRYNKKFGSRIGSVEFRDIQLSEGYDYGLCSSEFSYVTRPYLIMCVKLINKSIKYSRYRKKIRRSEMFSFKLFPRMPITRKSTGVRMGKGKGKVREWGCTVKKNKLFLEFSKYVHPKLVVPLLDQIRFRLPFKSELVLRRRIRLKKIL